MRSGMPRLDARFLWYRRSSSSRSWGRLLDPPLETTALRSEAELHPDSTSKPELLRVVLVPPLRHHFFLRCRQLPSPSTLMLPREAASQFFPIAAPSHSYTPLEYLFSLPRRLGRR